MKSKIATYFRKDNILFIGEPLLNEKHANKHLQFNMLSHNWAWLLELVNL